MYNSMRMILFTLTLAMPLAAADLLRVSADGRGLETADGRAFLWLGDTAWELFHRLDREEALHYLDRRAAQGFTVIQAVVLAEGDGLRTPNAYGQVPLIDLDPRQPNEAYFEHVDFIVREAARRGMRVAMLPTWGDKVPSSNPRPGPVVFDRDNAREYGRYLGRRYREAPIVWMLGGDRPVDSEAVAEIWRAMAQGVREGDGGAHLITFHPSGEASSAWWFHNEPWLDFNVYQSGHAARFQPVYGMAADHLLLYPKKPFIDAEPPYEDIPIAFWEFIDWSLPEPVPPSILDESGLLVKTEFFKRGLFTDYDVRVHAYWNLLAGAAGFTYGNNAVWQMLPVGRTGAIPALHGWRDALERPGAMQMAHLRELFERRPLAGLHPDQSIIYGRNGGGRRHLRAALARDHTFALVYLAEGREIKVVLGKVKGDRVRVSWFNPRTGGATDGGERSNTGIATFIPPEIGEVEDWILVLDAGDVELPPLPREQGDT